MPVNVNIQTSESRNLNFLGRKRIKQKDELFKAFLIEREDGKAKVEISYNVSAIYQSVRLDISSETNLILDIFVLGKVTRRILSKEKSSEYIELEDVPDGAIPRLRLKITSDNNETVGVIFAATAKLIKFKSIIPDERDPDEKSKKSLLDAELSNDLEGCLVKVKWENNSDITIKFDRSFFRKYEANSGLLRLALYPDMIRSISINLLSRFDELEDLDETCSAYRWLRFIEDRLELSILGEDGIYNPSFSENLPDKVEEIVEKFMAIPWNSGKTLLEDAINAD